jgi:hypothetical protein
MPGKDEDAMKLDELITITEKLRTVNIPDAEAQSNLDAAIVYLDLTINRVRVAAKQPAAQAAQRGDAGFGEGRPCPDCGWADGKHFIDCPGALVPGGTDFGDGRPK